MTSCAREVLAVGLLSQPRVVAQAVAENIGSHLGGFLGRALGRRLANAAAPARLEGLPSQYLLALTAVQLHALAYRPEATGLRITGHLRSWDRATITHVGRAPGRLADRLTIAFAVGSTLESDAPQAVGGADLSGPFVVALGAVTCTS